MNRNMAPSLQLNFSRDKKYQRNKFVMMENMIRFWKTFIFIRMGVPTRKGTKRVIPRINVMLTKLLPKMSPKASPG